MCTVIIHRCIGIYNVCRPIYFFQIVFFRIDLAFNYNSVNKETIVFFFILSVGAKVSLRSYPTAVCRFAKKERKFDLKLCSDFGATSTHGHVYAFSSQGFPFTVVFIHFPSFFLFYSFVSYM